MDCIIHVARTKALISCAVTAELKCAFPFAYAKNRFSHEVRESVTSSQYHRPVVIACEKAFCGIVSIENSGGAISAAATPQYHVRYRSPPGNNMHHTSF